MAAKEINFSSFGEMIYYFFRKKRCSVCGSKLRKYKTEEKKGFQIWKKSFGIGVFDYECGNLNTVKINYYCPKCKKMRTLSETYEMYKSEE